MENMEHIENGIYFIKFKIGDKTLVKQLVKK